MSRLVVRIVLPLQGADRELENRQAIALWAARALRRRFEAGTIDVGHRPDQGLIITSSYAPLHGGALTAAAGVVELVSQAIDLELNLTRPPRARRALEALFDGIHRATVTVRPERTPA
jgi:hypothetical protein